MTELSPREALRQRIRLDVIFDTLGNTALALGLWGWFGEVAEWAHWLSAEPVIIVLTATGVLNLLHLPARLRRLREWRSL
ncbi:MAG: hypothetical protein ACRERR_13635 [Moraxellaceae bacterium]